MAAPTSRLDRLVQTIGEENLPAKLPAKPVIQSEGTIETRENETPTDPFSKLQSVDDFMKEHYSENWWDATPTLPQPVKQATAQQAHIALTPLSYSSGGAFQSNPRRGEPAPLGINFAPFLAVTKLPCE